MASGVTLGTNMASVASGVTLGSNMASVASGVTLGSTACFLQLLPEVVTLLHTRFTMF